MVRNTSIEELRKVIALSDLPDEHLGWILEHGEAADFEDGAVVIKTGEPTEIMWFLLEGRIDFYIDTNGKLTYYYSFENTAETGGAGGLLPYSRMKTSLGWAYAVGKVRTIGLNKMHFQELEQLNPDLIQKLIGYMTERARFFATKQLQHEKVNALGNLAAGIAHELNNPASAINRIASELTKRLNQNYELTEQLLLNAVSPQHIQMLGVMVDKKEKERKQQPKLSSMQLMEKEDEIISWLEKNNIPANKVAGETFAEFGFSCQDLEDIHLKAGNDALVPVLHWLENLLNSQRILKDLDDASCRISQLVSAIKSHVHMDQTNDMQPSKINVDIDNTLTLLGYKLHEKNISIKKDYAEKLPDIPAYIGELNQVWTNIIDNAIFAMNKDGELQIKITYDNKNLNVCIVDNGPGIPKEIMSRIFDPFFTTKKVGQGTGIGLDLVQRIVKRHHGEIKVNSVPGRTEFKICLPLKQDQKELQ